MSTHNLDLAKQHSYYYANHLTELGRWLSDKREYSQAASVFKFITECDAHDAYAWEYYAYNLAMSGQASSGLSGNDTHIILDAYARASNLEPENPLYRGREIGFRARMGTPIQRLFAEYVRRFQNNGRKQAGIFALHALRGIADPRERERLTIGHEWLKKNPEIKELMP